MLPTGEVGITNEVGAGPSVKYDQESSIHVLVETDDGMHLIIPQFHHIYQIKMVFPLGSILWSSQLDVSSHLG